MKNLQNPLIKIGNHYSSQVNNVKTITSYTFIIKYILLCYEINVNRKLMKPISQGVFKLKKMSNISIGSYHEFIFIKYQFDAHH